MALCQSCERFYDDAGGCPSCGSSDGMAFDLLGRTAPPAARASQGQRRTLARLMPRMELWELILGVAWISGLAGMTKAFAPAKISGNLGLVVIYSFVGGLSLAGWSRMLICRRRGYEGRDIGAWWSVTLWTLGMPLAIGLLGQLQREKLVGGSMIFGVSAWIATLIFLISGGGPRETSGGYQARLGIFLAITWQLLGPTLLMLWLT